MLVLASGPGCKAEKGYDIQLRPVVGHRLQDPPNVLQQALSGSRGQARTCSSARKWEHAIDAQYVSPICFIYSHGQD